MDFARDFYDFDFISDAAKNRPDNAKNKDPAELLKPEQDPKLVVSVFDNGVGIKEQDQAKLF